MSAPSRRRGPGSNDPAQLLPLFVFGALALAAVGVWLTLEVAAFLDSTPGPASNNPFEVSIGLFTGKTTWTGTASKVAVGVGVLLLTLATLVIALVCRALRKRVRVDAAAAHMGRGGEIASLSKRGALAAATRLSMEGQPGQLIANSVAGGQPLYASWEDVCVDIWGPRTGKTTSRAVPCIVAAPGAVLATSNKRDLVDATRDLRSDFGSRGVWVFDPQGIAGEPADWWWNPLTYVTDEVKAATLAGVLVGAAQPEGARKDAFFDSAGQSLLAALLLAAAVDGRPITDVFLWLTDPTDERPAEILKKRYPLEAAELYGHINSADKQRSGVYGTARQTAGFLRNRAATQWVTSPSQGGDPHDVRREFDPHDFVASKDTLYLLSKEGEGTSGPLVAALTVAVTEAAEQLATTQPGGRLSTPMIVVLDEAANVCRWKELPNKYSHYGSRGILLTTILQSWSQGVEVWGERGMSKLWSAANVKVYGGGVDDRDFLDRMSATIGDYERTQISSSSSRHGHTTSRQAVRERILDVSDLAALPKGRAVVFSSGNRPVLARTVPWMSSPHAEAIRASIRAHDPAAELVIAEAEQSLHEVRARESGAPLTAAATTSTTSTTSTTVSAVRPNRWLKS
ncbi:type IV secretory system conjugative DNA transfer family protein [Kineococcus sp. SYSU DK006]|uniref:type IV secretory system conjugative DNA transfer family protein n=1 Tax=Kineococcus sp. SYSU DK006 TaxID=3383127 RepID=UPI003D7C8F3F